MWMQSKSGMWHLVGQQIKHYGMVAKCKPFNFNQTLWLSGDQLPIPPTGEKVCQRCSKIK